MRGSVLGPHPPHPTSPPTRCSPEPPPCCVPLTVPPGRLAEVEAVLGAAVREHLPGGAEHPAGRQPLTDRTQRPQRSHWGWKGGGGGRTWCRRGIVPAGPRRLPHPPPPPLRPLPPPPPARRPPPPWIPSAPAPRVPLPGPSRQLRARRGGTGRLWGDGGGRGRARPLAAASRAPSRPVLPPRRHLVGPARHSPSSGTAGP